MEIDGYYRLRCAETKGAGVKAMLESVLLRKLHLGLRRLKVELRHRVRKK